VGRFNKHDRTEVNDLFRGKILPVPISSIASVCLTDTETVDFVLKEICATIKDLARRGRSMRLNFKIGYLLVQN